MDIEAFPGSLSHPSDEVCRVGLSQNLLHFIRICSEMIFAFGMNTQSNIHWPLNGMKVNPPGRCGLRWVNGCPGWMILKNGTTTWKFMWILSIAIKGAIDVKHLHMWRTYEWFIELNWMAAEEHGILRGRKGTLYLIPSLQCGKLSWSDPPLKRNYSVDTEMRWGGNEVNWNLSSTSHFIAILIIILRFICQINFYSKSAFYSFSLQVLAKWMATMIMRGCMTHLSWNTNSIN